VFAIGLAGHAGLEVAPIRRSSLQLFYIKPHRGDPLSSVLEPWIRNDIGRVPIVPRMVAIRTVVLFLLAV